MAIIRSDSNDPVELSLIGEDYDCSLCGQRADAYARGDVGAVKVCHRCAATALPQLIAEAVVAGPAKKDALTAARDAEIPILLNYWKSAANAIFDVFGGHELNRTDADREAARRAREDFVANAMQAYIGEEPR